MTGKSNTPVHALMQAAHCETPDYAHLDCDGTSALEILSKMEQWKSGCHLNTTVLNVGLGMREKYR